MLNKAKAAFKNRKVLVTGGAGFIGSNLCDEMLSIGAQVVCVDNLITGRIENISELKKHPNFTFTKGCLTEYAVCESVVSGVEVVFHQAALGSVPRSIENPILTNQHNITAFLNILEAARKEGVKRFVYAASSSTYGDSESLPKVEDVIGAPLSPYAVSKYCNELYAQVFQKLYGLETIGLRYFNVFGRNQDPDGAYAAVIPKFIAKYIQHEPITINGDGEQSRDFTYIDNVLQANLLAGSTTNSNAFGEVFNVAFGSRTTLNTLVNEMKYLLASYDAEIKNVKTIYGDERRGDIRHSHASIEKGKEMLGYQPIYSPEEGLKAAIDWYWDTLSKKQNT